MLGWLEIQEQTRPQVDVFVQSGAGKVLKECQQVLNTVHHGGEA